MCVVHDPAQLFQNHGRKFNVQDLDCLQALEALCGYKCTACLAPPSGAGHQSNNLAPSRRPLPWTTRLRAVVATIHDDICASSVAGRIASKIEVGALQFRSFTLSAHGNLVLPDILGLLRDKVADLRGHVARRNAVSPRKLHPLDRQALAQVNHTRLGRIIRRLQLRDIDDMARHGRRSDERPALEAVEPVLPLLAPHRTAGSGAVEGAVEIGADDLLVVVDLTVDHGALGPGDAGVGDEDVETVVEFGDLGFDGFLDFLRVLDVDLVGLAWEVRAGLGEGAGWL